MKDNSHSFEENIVNFIKDNALCNEGEEIVLAVSGGADSVAMLLCMNAIKDILKAQIKVVHIEHGIRGQESIEDSKYVDNLCKRLGVECIIVPVDAPKLAKDQGLSMEEAARKLRYEALFAQGSVVATAHNADDNAETVLFNLIRGTGIAGLCGIESKSIRREGVLIRPLITTSRMEIEEYLKSCGQDYRTDSTNRSLDYSRNRIRLEVIPILKDINKRAVEHINDASGHLYSIKNITDTYVKDSLRSVISENGICIQKLREMDPDSRRMILMSYLYNVTNGSHNLGSTHFYAIESLLDKEVGKRVSIPGFEVYRDYEYLRVVSADDLKEAEEHDKINITTDREKLSEGCLEYDIPGYKIKLNLRDRISPMTDEAIPRQHYTKWFDYDKIDSAPAIRYRQEGDYITMDSGLRKKPFRRYCIDEKIPSGIRDNIPLLCDGSHIIWVLGYRISEYYKVTTSTKAVLEIVVEEKNNG